jgi:RNA polymerase sigma factor (sigma-70 family)
MAQQPEPTAHAPQQFRQLMKRIRRGSEEAVRELLKTYGGHILRIVRRRLPPRLRSKYDSRDFEQAVWTSFFTRSLRDYSFDRPEELIAFLESVASNKVVDAVRKGLVCDRWSVNHEHSLEGSAAQEVGRMPAPTPTPSQVAIANETWDQVRSLPRPAQVLVELLRAGLTYEQIARKFHVTVKTVQRLVRNIVPRLAP